MYKNVKKLGPDKTKQLRDGLLTKINLYYKNIGAKAKDPRDLLVTATEIFKW